MSEQVPGSESYVRAQERRELLRERMDHLERALAQPAVHDVASWQTEVRAVVDELTAALGEHVAETEQSGGFFDELLDTAPRIAHRIEELRAEHPRLVAAVGELRATLEPGHPAEDPVATTRERGVALLAALLHHRQVGADLLYEAYWVDVATAD